MRSTILTKTLLAVLIVGLFCSLAPRDAFAAGRQHHRGGRFYRPYDNRFVVVRPRAGTFVRFLPYGHRVFMHRGARYYCHENVYYRDCNRGYMVVEDPFTLFFSIILK